MSTPEQIIAAHPYIEWRLMCQCMVGDPGRTAMSRAEHAAHVVAALTNAGKAIVDLPEADEVIRHGTGETFPSWETFGGAVTVEWVAGAEISMFSGDYLLDVADARGLAARLLAAARVAEGGEQP